MKNFSFGIFLLVVSFNLVFILSCNPNGGPSKQYCVTVTLENVPEDVSSQLTDPNSAWFKFLKQSFLIDVDRIASMKNWKNHLKPAPKFCTFQTGENSTSEVAALMDVWTNADQNEIQKELDPDDLLHPAPIYPLKNITAALGPCKSVSNQACHP